MCACWLVIGHTDMRKGFLLLALQVQEVLRRDPLSGICFCFCGRRGDLLKVIWHGRPGRVPVHEAAGTRTLPLWPEPGPWRGDEISAAQLGDPLSGIDWRHPQENLGVPTSLWARGFVFATCGRILNSFAA